MRFTHRAVLLGVVAAAALGASSLNVANAGWYNCTSSQHVAYNPLTGRSIQVGHAEEVGSLDRPVWAWVCVDDGGITGAHSIGHATYLGSNGAGAHTLVCPSTQEPCVQTWIGASVNAPSSGQTGARPCVAAAVTDVCVSAGVTPGGAVVPAIELPTGSGDFCVVNVVGVCAVQRATVRTGGNVATVYVDNTPVSVDVPALCVGTSRPGQLVTVQQGSDC